MRYELPEDGFALALPAAWERLDPDPQIIDKYETIFQKQIERLKEIFPSDKVQSLSGSGVKFHAADIGRLEDPAEPTGMLYVIKVDFGLPLPIAALTRANMQRLATLLEDDSSFSFRTVDLANRQATELKFALNVKGPDGEKIERYVTQYIVIEDDMIYLLTMHCPTSKASFYGKEFEAIGKRFEMLE